MRALWCSTAANAGCSSTAHRQYCSIRTTAWPQPAQHTKTYSNTRCMSLRALSLSSRPQVGSATAAAAATAQRCCQCNSIAPGAEPVPPLVVVEGDIVTFHMTCKGEEGQVLESSRDAGEPLSFEIGAGEITGNPLYQAFDGALRGLGVEDVIELEISGGEWKQELLFTVPRDHPEVERLEGRYKNLGGLQKDLAVELANGTMAVVVETTPEHVKLDANNMMSGKKLLFELEVLSIERPAA